jgi:hypothetical protein
MHTLFNLFHKINAVISNNAYISSINNYLIHLNSNYHGKSRKKSRTEKSGKESSS